MHENLHAGHHDANHVGEEEKKGSLRHLIGESGDGATPPKIGQKHAQSGCASNEHIDANCGHISLICTAFLRSPPRVHRSCERRSNHTLQQPVAPTTTRLDSERSIALANLQVRRAVTPLHVQGLLEPAGRAGDGPGLQGW